MKRTSKYERGQALILIAFGVIGLVAMVGLAVDGGHAFFDRRRAQNAADTASITGALEKIHEVEAVLGTGGDPTATMDAIKAALVVAAKDIANINGYDDDKVTNTVYVYNPPIEGPYACDVNPDDCEDYVQVIIESHINTYFAKVIGVDQMHNRVEAVAKSEAGVEENIFGGDSIISLKPECSEPGTMIISGDADITVTGGGLFVNTTDPDACGFTCNSNGGTIDGDITIAGGGYTLSDHCQDNITGGEPSQAADPWEFPIYLEDIFGAAYVPPAACSGAAGTYRNTTALELKTNYATTLYPLLEWDAANPPADSLPVTVLSPGHYADFPPKKEQPLGSLNDVIVMEPGVYCVDSVVKLVDRNLVLLGKGITVWIEKGNYFSMEGGTIRLEADYSETNPYAGYLMIVSPDYTIGPENCKIDGNSNNSFTGAIFAPYCNITINGGSEPTAYNSQVIGYTVKITGTAAVNFYYDGDQNPVWFLPAETGLFR